ncbi:hypothetical protein BUALT_Bualt11G0074700 [Buddleja alternifolia]|uniref:TOG domain-containing protein n=1 Tax=Buddleja alternifolia TaxID=168488 RepID=A0AAV6X442_9LAMI|nr:hypothetical protein BUALT_Bualt11G0074700 [Buddleja alternifolia]
MLKGKATSRVSNQQAAFQLKQRVLLALNKLADRDTHQIGVEELEKTVECLTPDGFVPFLSCILDTDSEQKSAVRKECIHLMGTLAIVHERLVGPHLGKMVASIVKRLKDSDSIVRDSCIETVGILASKLSGSRIDNDGIFTVLVRPLFEALSEQNRHVQSGSALCLSRVIDNIHDPPPPVLQKILSKTVKLLKNPHFMAKPAVIELNRSIVLAGGAPTHSSLTAALSSIQEALKSSDWATRKAACAALGDIASYGAACLGSFRTLCIRCLESCRFDKVKPVRDVALQALQLWRNLPGSGTPEPSEAGSSFKETSYRDDYGDIGSASDSTLKDITQMKSGSKLARKRVPLSSRKASRMYIEKSPQSVRNDWHVEIAFPKSRNISAVENQNDESEGSCITKRCESINADVRSSTTTNIGYDYVEGDDKREHSYVSDLFTESIKSKVVTAHCDVFDEASLVKSTGTSQQFAADEVSIEEQRYLAKMHDRRSLDSTVTESTSQVVRGCCSQTEKDMVLIRNQLLEIENKQSSLMDMLKAFTITITDSMSTIQRKVSNLENVVDKMAQELVHGGRYSDALTTKLLNVGPNIASPRLSTSTPRLSVDSNTFTRSRSSRFRKQNSDMWGKGSSRKGTPSSLCQEIHGDQIRKTDNVLNSVPLTATRLNKLETKNSSSKVVKDYLCDGDLDSAYGEALGSRNELVLFELLDRTGSVLESLSEKTASDLLSILALYLLEQRFAKSIIPWLQQASYFASSLTVFYFLQLVDLSNIHGPNYLVLSSKAKRDFLFAIQEAAKSDVYNSAERKFFIELSKSLRQIWG